VGLCRVIHPHIQFKRSKTLITVFEKTINHVFFYAARRASLEDKMQESPAGERGTASDFASTADGNLRKTRHGKV
jgi:hypothetical protein